MARLTKKRLLEAACDVIERAKNSERLARSDEARDRYDGKVMGAYAVWTMLGYRWRDIENERLRQMRAKKDD